MKYLKKIGLGFSVILLIGIIASGIYLFGKKPDRNQDLVIEGLKEKVTVIYDKFGIPHIYANNDEDMYRAFGYIHAQDRLFQMELLRRIGQGRLSEIFGEKAIKVDRMFRTLQINKFTDKWMTHFENRSSKRILRGIDAYLSGVNQFIKNGATPIEFDMLGISKTRYTRKDMAAVMGYMAHSFTFGLSQDLLITTLTQTLGKEYIKDLNVRWQKGSTQIKVNRKGIESLSKNINSVISQLTPLGLFHGSNGWVISPGKTESGKAMLVNDPHMGFSQPSVWYEAHLVSPESEIYGHHLALLPFAMLGNNRDIAWGLTMFVNDDVDLFKEKINPENPNQYWAIDHWENFELSTDIIKVKDSKDVVLKLKKSRHGPIITDAFSGFKDHKNTFKNTKDQLSMWWVFYNIDNDFFTAFYDLARSKNVRQASIAVSKIYAPGLNVMYADKHGDIAWWAAAKLPIRPKHVNSSIILDGSSGKDDPLGYYDFSKNPQALNPDSGVIYTANNQPADTGIGLIPGYYPARDRSMRIEEFLFSDEKKWNAKKMKEMLLDSITPLAKEVQKIVIPILKSDPDVNKNKISKKALSIFAKWKGDHNPEGKEATLFYYFKKELFKQVMLDEMGEHSYGIYSEIMLIRRTIWTLLPNINSPWWDNIKTKNIKETRSQIVVSSWLKTIQSLEDKFGSDIEKWKWKYSVKMKHTHPLGAVTPLNYIFNVGPFIVPAGNGIINNLVLRSSTDNFKVNWGPSTRRIIDFGNIDSSWGINPTGQSGNVMDKHYSDQSKLFAKGIFRRQYTLKSDIMKHKEDMLEMKPE